MNNKDITKLKAVVRETILISAEIHQKRNIVVVVPSNNETASKCLDSTCCGIP